MGTRLYIGNLSYSTQEDALRAAFGENGRQVAEVTIITDRMTGQPRGFAFVEMASPADAEAAIEAMDGYQLDGRTLRVSEARERARGPGGPRGGGPGGGFGGGPPRDDRGGGGGRRGGGRRGRERNPYGDDGWK
ncbi:MAG TPA: RNA-binding protein [Kofleriaceae bacterium]|nr:RNA-binding protein [Kofleriaceae bacterium]